MCGAILCAFHLVGHVRRSPHLGAETAVLLWPLKPRTHSPASTGQHRPVRTQHNRRAAPLTGEALASDQMLRGCVWIYTCLCVSSQNKTSQGWLSVSRRLDGGWVEGWRVRDRKTDMSGWGGMENHKLTARVLFFLLQSLNPFWPGMIKIILIVADLKFRYNLLLFCRKGFQPTRQKAQLLAVWF